MSEICEKIEKSVSFFIKQDFENFEVTIADVVKEITSADVVDIKGVKGPENDLPFLISYGDGKAVIVYVKNYKYLKRAKDVETLMTKAYEDSPELMPTDVRDRLHDLIYYALLIQLSNAYFAKLAEEGRLRGVNKEIRNINLIKKATRILVTLFPVLFFRRIVRHSTMSPNQIVKGFFYSLGASGILYVIAAAYIPSESKVRYFARKFGCKIYSPNDLEKEIKYEKEWFDYEYKLIKYSLDQSNQNNRSE